MIKFDIDMEQKGKQNEVGMSGDIPTVMTELTMALAQSVRALDKHKKGLGKQLLNNLRFLPMVVSAELVMNNFGGADATVIAVDMEHDSYDETLNKLKQQNLPPEVFAEVAARIGQAYTDKAIAEAGGRK